MSVITVNSICIVVSRWLVTYQNDLPTCRLPMPVLTPPKVLIYFFYLFKHFVVYITQEISIHTKRNKKDILQVIKGGI